MDSCQRQYVSMVLATSGVCQTASS